MHDRHAPSDVQEVYNQFWKPMLKEQGVEDVPDPVKAELHDYHVLLTEVPKVYMHVTGNQVSKHMTKADVVIALADDVYSADIREKRDELLAEIDQLKAHDCGDLIPTEDVISLVKQIF